MNAAVSAWADSPYVEYRVPWKVGGVRPGAFRGQIAGPGDRYRSSVPLHGRADPRRLDLRASLRDPFGGIWVRDFEQNTALKVIVLADVSASMGFLGRHDKAVQLRLIATTLARTAWRNGDAFGFFAANEKPLAELMLAVRIHRGASEWLEQRLAAFTPHGAGADGLLQLRSLLPQRRALLFLVSDFHWPDGLLESALRAFSHHAVVPVVLWDPAEAEAIHRHGFAVLDDMENGGRRFVWLRSGLVDKLRKRRGEREAKLRSVARRFGCSPFFVRGEFEANALTRHFLETAA